MLINLQETTQEYWHKLDELETAYQQGKISINYHNFNSPDKYR